jgi:hypothetical protein
MFFKSTKTRGEKIDEKLCWAKSDSPFFLDRTELNTKELGLQALIDISPPFSLSTKNVGEVFYRLHSLSSSLLSSTFCGFDGGGESTGGG